MTGCAARHIARGKLVAGVSDHSGVTPQSAGAAGSLEFPSHASICVVTSDMSAMDDPSQRSVNGILV